MALGAKTPLFSRHQQGGVFTIVNEEEVTGEVFYVDDSGTDAATNGGNPDNPLATTDYAIGLCVAGRGDQVRLMSGHAETVTASITCDIADVSIVGMGGGGQRPVITGNGAIDAMTLTAANIRVENIEFAIPGTDAQTSDINIAAAGCVVRNTIHHGSTTSNNKVDIITLTSAADDAIIEDVTIYNDTVECVGGIVLEGACSRVTIRNAVVHDSIGFTNGSLSDEATALQLTVEDCVFSNAKADTVCVSFANNTTGVMRNSFVNGRHTTIQSNLAPGTGMAFCQVYGVEEAAKNGLYMPAQDAE